MADATQIPTLAQIYQAKKDIQDINTFTRSTALTFVDYDGITKMTLTGITAEANERITEEADQVSESAALALQAIAETAAEIPEALSSIGTNIPYNEDIKTIETGGLIKGNWVVDAENGDQHTWLFQGTTGYWWPMNPSYGTVSHQALPERNGPSRHIASDIDMGGGNSLANLTTAGSTVPVGGVTAGSIASRVRNTISPRENGAVNDGVSDDTLALKDTFNNAIPVGDKILLSGDYLISGPITNITNISEGELVIECLGNVRIIVDDSSVPFSDIIYFHTDLFNNAIITGGSLTIDGNNKVPSGITIRHDDGSGGQVKIDAKLVLTNFLESNEEETRENQALLIFGEYTSIEISKPFIKSVSRTNVSAGATKGVSVAGISGICVIDEPYVEGVLCPDGGADADGISIFGKQSAGANSTRLGRAIVNKPTLVNNKGRSFKSQVSDVTVSNPKVVRTGAVVTIPQGVDFDFQFSGNVLLDEPVYEYLEVGAVSPFPIGNSFSPVVFQQLLDDKSMIGRSLGGTMYTQVTLPRYALVVSDAGAKDSLAEVSGLRVVPIGEFSGSAFERAILEIDIGIVASKTAKTTLSVSDVKAPLSATRAIGYTGYVSGDLSAKLSYEVENNFSTLKATTNRTFSTISGTAVGEVLSFKISDNVGFRDLLDQANQIFDFSSLVVGSKFTVDLSTLGSVTNAPAWGVVGYATIEVVSQWFGFEDLCIRVTVGNATAANSVFYTQDGGTTWGVIK